MGFCSVGKNGNIKDIEDGIDNSVVIIKEIIRKIRGYDDKTLYKKIYNLLFEVDVDLVKAGLCSEEISKRTGNSALNREFLTEVIQNVMQIEAITSNQCVNTTHFPEDQFVLEHYLEDENAVVYPTSIKNLEKVYNNLKKIFNYYKQTGRLPKRNNRSHLIIVRGLMSGDSCDDIFGDRKNPHCNGRAVDFKFDSINTETVYNDITDGRITLDKGCEVLLLRDSIHLGITDSMTSRFEVFKKLLY